MDNPEEFGISLCSGYGGLDRGLELAGVKSRIVAYVEIEAYAVANLVAKMETGLLVPAPVWTNLKTFPMDAFRGRVDFITAGYPCQPFSCAGQRKGTDDPRHLWLYIRRIYQTIQPRWMFFENVEGHVTLGLSTVISDLEEDGYKVEAGLFTAAEVGAPHRRKRVFILAESLRPRTRGQCENRPLSKDRRNAIQSYGLQSTSQVDVRGNGDCRKHEKELVNTRSPQLYKALEEKSKINVRPSNASFKKLGYSPSIRPCGTCENLGSVKQDKGGEERRVCQFEGTSALPGKQPQESVGDTEHDGRTAEPELRSNEATGNSRRTEEQRKAGELTRTGRPANVSSLSGSETGGELSDTNIVRSQREWPNSYPSGREGQNERQTGLCHGTRWPARPGQPQYAWEEPRVVEQPMGKPAYGSSGRMGRVAGRMAVSANRTDELRLLGNGVCPQQAARAYLVLRSR